MVNLQIEKIFFLFKVAKMFPFVYGGMMPFGPTLKKTEKARGLVGVRGRFKEKPEFLCCYLR